MTAQRAALAELAPVARLMARLCEIPSPSRQETAVAQAVRAELADLGAEVQEDDAAARLGSGCGNILARFPRPVPAASRSCSGPTSTPSR